MSGAGDKNLPVFPDDEIEYVDEHDEETDHVDERDEEIDEHDFTEPDSESTEDTVVQIPLDVKVKVKTTEESTSSTADRAEKIENLELPIADGWNQEELIIDGTRSRKPTEKYVAWQQERMISHFKAALSAWRKRVLEVENLLTECKSKQRLLTSRDELNTSFREIEKATSQLELEGRNEYVVKFESIQEDQHNLVKLLGAQIRLLQKNEDGADSIYSRSSRRSQGSRRSTTSSLVTKRAEVAAQAASLRIELENKAMEEKAELDLARAQARLGRVKLEKELGMAEARLRAMEEVENEDDFGVTRCNRTLMAETRDDFGVTRCNKTSTSTPPTVTQLVEVPAVQSSIVSPVAQSLARQPVRVPAAYPVNSLPHIYARSTPAVTSSSRNRIDVRAPVFVPAVTTYTSTGSESMVYSGYDNNSSPGHVGVQHSAQIQDSNTYLMDKVLEQLSWSRLPVPEPGVFSGDILKFPGWITSFNALVDRRSIPADEKLFYLKRYLSGEAREAVEGHFILGTESAYVQARAFLQKRYGDTFRIADAFRDKLESWPKLPSKDGPALRRFADFLAQCQVAMSSISGLNILNDERESRKLLRKLPEWVVNRWSRKVASHRKEFGAYPDFVCFVNFIQQEADIACDPITSVYSLNQNEFKGRKSTDARTLSTNTSAETPEKTPEKTPEETKVHTTTTSEVKCVLCSKSHILDNCYKFQAMSSEEKKQLIMKRALCFGCLTYGHRSRDCRRRMTCKKCSSKHPTSLHDVQPESKTTNPDIKMESQLMPVESFATHSSSSGAKSTMIVPVWLSHEDSTTEVMVYALLDTQSDTTFVSESVTTQLDLHGEKTYLKLTTMAVSEKVIESSRHTGLVVRAYNGSDRILLPPVYSRDVIPVSRDHIPTPEVAKSWPHLMELADELMPLESCDCGVLIGYDCAQVLTPRAVIPAPKEMPRAPYGLKTDLGWSIVGCVAHDTMSRPSVEDSTDVVYTCRTKAKEIINPIDVIRVLESDLIENSLDVYGLSVDDKKFLLVMNEGIHKTEDGHYEMPLPLRDPKTRLPDNRMMALKRLHQLRGRLIKNNKFRADYTVFMNDVVQKGYAELVEDPPEPGRVWFLPHHGVYSKTNPDKIRVVFDGSAVTQNVSINDVLLRYDLTNDLVGVLCRFRREKIVLVCDVEQMFYQFRVNSEHRDFLRFLWWRDGDLESTPLEYRMTVHIFGAASSPGCASFGLRRIADDFESKYGSKAANFIRRDFYVDDGLTSVPTEEEAIQLFESTSKMCSEGGLRLHKVISNSKAVIDSIPVKDRATSIKHLDIHAEKLPVEKTLGVQWCLESDTFQFKITLCDRPLTRRGILSTICSLFDPLGFVCPVILTGRHILQELCAMKLDWDSPIPAEHRARWERWRTDLIHLRDIQIERCMKRTERPVESIELHHFSDASSTGYGQCSYLRIVDVDNKVDCSLVFGKAKVAPLKVVTIPRLELAAAVISITVSRMLRREYDQLKEIFWCDSQVVLGYIRNEARRFHVYVANRVQKIRDSSDSSQWHYVRSEDNPADEASRGITAKELKDSRWLYGPEFLWKPEVVYDNSDMIEVPESDPELKRVQVLSVTGQEVFDLDRFSYFSSWFGLRRAVAICLRYLRKLQDRVRVRKHDGTVVTDPGLPSRVTVSELEDAGAIIIRLVQREVFGSELDILHSTGPLKKDRLSRRLRNRNLRKSSRLARLDPFIDSRGVIRVGGRLSRSSYPDEFKHPAVMPQKHHVTTLILRNAHEKVFHQGRGVTMNEVRSHGYWVIGCTSAVSRLIYHCVLCRRLRGSLEQQKMSNLPIDRTESSPPFTYCGVDFFGPWLVKEGRREVKRWGVLFTCLASRAVHLETAVSLDTSSFINALRRFVAVRGPIRELRCDRGTNFVGAERALKEALKELDKDKIRSHLLNQGCDYFSFNMNPPSASHMGGVWERLIRSVRSVLNAMLIQLGTQLDDECLRTLMAEVAAIVNSRPLAVTDLADHSIQPLTPSQILTMKSKVILPPPGIFQKEDMYTIRRWRRVQHLANEFWNRWRKDYLITLNSRQKWTASRRNLQTGDIVIVKDEHLHRNHWPLARITKTYPGEDGHVRHVEIVLGTSSLDRKGRRTTATSKLERPVHKLVLLKEVEETRESQSGST